MEREVKLYLASQEVEFSSIPDILYNFKVDDITSPAAIKNTYSKTVTIPATPNNNRIFGSFYKNDFEGMEGGDLSGAYFDPRKRMPFILTINGVIYESGYARLEKVTQNKSEYNYQLLLFGGLGDFFYNLEYGEDAGKRKMSSLIFDTDNLDFTINANTLYTAWKYNRGNTDKKFDIINFAPCYDGVPSNFSADKVLVNYSGITEPVIKLGYSSITEDNVTYSTYNNYYVAELPKSYTQAEMREYRSWMQRPILSVKKTIEAICNPENNGGYEVVLDEDFFNSGNSYYSSAWVTLPLLSEIKTSDYSTFDSYTEHSYSTTMIVRVNTNQVFYVRLTPSPSMPVNTSKVQMNAELYLKAGNNDPLPGSTLYTSAYVQNPPGPDATTRCFSGYLLQLQAFAGTDMGSSKLGNSEAVFLTSVLGNGDFLRAEETNSGFIDSSVKYSFGQYELVDSVNRVYKWNQPFTLTMDLPSGMKSLFFMICPLANTTTGTSYGGSQYTTYGNRRMRGYSATALTTSDVTNTATMVPDFTGNTQTSTEGNLYAYGGEGDTMGYTGAFITKNMLLDTDYSPLDFLTSYAKLFGLYFVKDPVEKKVSILTRANFFNRESITDISEYVDRTSVDITPLSFDSKWYNWGLEPIDSEFESQYESAYGKEYGNMDVNTGYEFNTEEKDVLNGNIFKNSIEALERSNMFYTIGDDDLSRPWMHNSYKYTLYNVNNMEESKEFSIPRSTTINRANLQEGYNFYDIFSKPVFHKENNDPVDGKNVLLIYNGKVGVGTFDLYGLKAYLTDDVPEMGVLNSNEACWLYTQGGDRRYPKVYGYDGSVIAIRVTTVPHYSRFSVSEGSSFISRSLDFGIPEKIYTPGLGYTENATMYNFFWREYMEEIFSKNSRIMKCKMLINETPSVDWLRRFYYFDNTIWRMTSIKDWNVANDRLTDVEFVRVKNITKYTSENPTGYKDIFLSIDDNQVQLQGGTINMHIRTITNDISWTLDCPDGVTASQSSGQGDYEGTLTISASESPRRLTVTAYSPAYSDSETILQIN